MSERKPLINLTSREQQVLSILAEEPMTYSQLAIKMGLSFSTIRHHLHNAYIGLGINTEISDKTNRLILAINRAILAGQIPNPYKPSINVEQTPIYRRGLEVSQRKKMKADSYNP